ncbi:MAG TPA: ATP-binding protein [Candidatus Dormibacteraeota bacterium]|nr:ATP-binding protein [Candidatus Dormibacteraeota bacterium]
MRPAGRRRGSPPDRTATAWGVAAALGGTVTLTLVLVRFGTGQQRDYVFLYLGLVAALGLGAGLAPSLVAAAASFLCVDFFFVDPVHTLTIADETDLVNLLVFFGAAGLVGGLGSRRRSAQLQAEAFSRELTAANRELERLNREQAAAARTAVRLAHTEQQVRALEQTDRLRRELLANVSHELRTPLGSILVGTTALEARPDLPADARGELSALSSEARRLARLVSDMLDLTRIEGGTLDLDLTDVDLVEAADAAVARLHRRTPDRVVRVESRDVPLEVVADWDRLGQVLDNLLANADRHAPAGTPIEVRITVGARSMAIVRVVDRGPGIPAELRDRVFDRFVRGPRTETESDPGTGLGLAIVRGLVEAHGGRAWLEDPEAGEGARIAFSIPVRTDAVQEPETEPAGAVPTS